MNVFSSLSMFESLLDNPSFISFAGMLSQAFGSANQPYMYIVFLFHQLKQNFVV